MDEEKEDEADRNIESGAPAWWLGSQGAAGTITLFSHQEVLRFCCRIKRSSEKPSGVSQLQIRASHGCRGCQRVRALT